MKRLEIICNNSIFEDVDEVLRNIGDKVHYTKIEDVCGVGKNGEKWGNSVWPENNFIIITICSDIVSKKIINALKIVKEKFPDEGLNIYSSSVENLL